MTVTFETLKSNYPTMEKNDLFDLLGGQWPDLKTEKAYNNTCAVRLSHAFNESGDPIPRKYRDAIDKDGRNIILKVSEFDKFVKEKYKQFIWGISKQPKKKFPISDLPSEYEGIIAYHGKFSEAQATGHFDLWTGSEFVGTGNEDDIEAGFDIYLWEVKVPPADA